MDLLGRIFSPPWLLVIAVTAGFAIADGQWDLALIVLVGVPLVRTGVLALVVRWQAAHYAGLGGAPERHHAAWHYARADGPVEARLGRRCARCNTRLRRGSPWFEGLAPLSRRPRIGQPPDYHLIPKDAPLWASYPYCPACGSSLMRQGSASPPPAGGHVITPPQPLPVAPPLLAGGAVAGIVLVVVLTTRNPCDGPACPCLRAWNAEGLHGSLATLRQIFPTLTSADVGRYSGPAVEATDAATREPLRVSSGACVVDPGVQRVYVRDAGRWGQAEVNAFEVRGTFMDATVVTDGTLRQ